MTTPQRRLSTININTQCGITNVLIKLYLAANNGITQDFSPNNSLLRSVYSSFLCPSTHINMPNDICPTFKNVTDNESIMERYGNMPGQEQHSLLPQIFPNTCIDNAGPKHMHHSCPWSFYSEIWIPGKARCHGAPPPDCYS